MDSVDEKRLKCGYVYRFATISHSSLGRMTGERAVISRGLTDVHLIPLFNGKN